MVGSLYHNQPLWLRTLAVWRSHITTNGAAARHTAPILADSLYGSTASVTSFDVTVGNQCGEYGGLSLRVGSENGSRGCFEVLPLP